MRLRRRLRRRHGAPPWPGAPSARVVRASLADRRTRRRGRKRRRTTRGLAEEEGGGAQRRIIAARGYAQCHDATSGFLARAARARRPRASPSRVTRWRIESRAPTPGGDTQTTVPADGDEADLAREADSPRGVRRREVDHVSPAAPSHRMRAARRRAPRPRCAARLSTRLSASPRRAGEDRRRRAEAEAEADGRRDEPPRRSRQKRAAVRAAAAATRLETAAEEELAHPLELREKHASALCSFTKGGGASGAHPAPTASPPPRTCPPSWKCMPASVAPASTRARRGQVRARARGPGGGDARAQRAGREDRRRGGRRAVARGRAELALESKLREEPPLRRNRRGRVRRSEKASAGRRRRARRRGSAQNSTRWSRRTRTRKPPVEEDEDEDEDEEASSVEEDEDEELALQQQKTRTRRGRKLLLRRTRTRKQALVEVTQDERRGRGKQRSVRGGGTRRGSMPPGPALRRSTRKSPPRRDARVDVLREVVGEMSCSRTAKKTTRAGADITEFSKEWHVPQRTSRRLATAARTRRRRRGRPWRRSSGAVGAPKRERLVGARDG